MTISVLEKAEAEYTAYRLAELANAVTVKYFDFSALCHVHYQIFQNIEEGGQRKIEYENMRHRIFLLRSLIGCFFVP